MLRTSLLTITNNPSTVIKFKIQRGVRGWPPSLAPQLPSVHSKNTKEWVSKSPRMLRKYVGHTTIIHLFTQIIKMPELGKLPKHSLILKRVLFYGSLFTQHIQLFHCPLRNPSLHLSTLIWILALLQGPKVLLRPSTGPIQKCFLLPLKSCSTYYLIIRYILWSCLVFLFGSKPMW